MKYLLKEQIHQKNLFNQQQKEMKMKIINRTKTDLNNQKLNTIIYKPLMKYNLKYQNRLLINQNQNLYLQMKIAQQSVSI